MTSPNSTPVDFTVENCGSVFLLHPQNDAACEHLKDNVEPDAQWFGNILAVEARFIGGLVSSLRESGWTVR